MALLSGYRVVDLTDERGLLAGHLLAKLGADVIQVEPPEGSPARRIGPFAPDGKSFYWSTYAAGKRSVALDLSSTAGRERLLGLIEQADFLFESHVPGELEAMGLGRDVLASVNPRLVHVSITAFGSDGPKAKWAASDLTLWAAGGALTATRDASGRPIRFSVPQSWLHASVDAACGALVAHFERVRSGRGQHVDASAQASITQSTLATLVADLIGHEGYDFNPNPRPGRDRVLDYSASGARTRKSKWRTRDGMVELHIGIGPSAGRVANVTYAWLRAEGALPEHLQDWDWQAVPERLMADEISERDIDEARDVVIPFFARHDTAALMQKARAHKVSLAPINRIDDVLRSDQFNARGAFSIVDEGGDARVVPWALAQGTTEIVTRPAAAPALGADNGNGFRDRPAPAAGLDWRLPGGEGRPLGGLLVVDLAWVVAGPAVGRVLADYGAQVIRIESSRKVCTARMIGPFPNGVYDIQRSAIFEECNTGKYSVAIDLAKAEGRAIVRDLVRQADVVLESFSPGQMARWGLDYTQLASENPRLVMLSSSLMGQTGPLAGFAGYGNAGAAIAGFQSLVGNPGEMPIGPYGPYTDFIAPRFGLLLLLAALDKRRSTGKGCWIDLSQAESALQLLAPQIADCAATGRVAGCIGNADPHYAPHGVYPCRGEDQWVAIAVADDAAWQRFATVLGTEAVAPAYLHASGRHAAASRLDDMVSQWTSRHTPAEVEAVLQRLGTAAHKVIEGADIKSDPQFLARGHFLSLPHPAGGFSVVEASKFKLSRTPARTERVAPSLGQDTDEILASLLGYDADRRAALRASGVLE